MHTRHLTALALLVTLLLVALAHAKILPATTLDEAMQEAEVIVLGTVDRGNITDWEGAWKQEFTPVRITHVIKGDPAAEGGEIEVRMLNPYLSRAAYPSRGYVAADAPPLEMGSAEIMLCLTRQKQVGLDEDWPTDSHRWSIAGEPGGVKLFNDQRVYGYYQMENPGWYYPMREEVSRDVLMWRAGRGIELGRTLGRLDAMEAQQAADDARIDLMLRPDTPGYYRTAAAEAISDKQRLREVIEAVLDAGDPDAPPADAPTRPAGPTPPTLTGEAPDYYPDVTPLAPALTHIEASDGLLPLLETVARRYPYLADRAKIAAARTLGPESLDFTKPARDGDWRTRHDLLTHLVARDEPATLALVEGEFEHDLLRRNAVADQFPAVWDDYGRHHADRFPAFEKRMLEKHPDHPDLQRSLDVLRTHYIEQGWLESR